MIAELTDRTDLPPGFELSEWAHKEWAQSPVPPADFIRASSKVWWVWDRDEVLFVCGIYAPSALGSNPELWMLASKNFRGQLRRRLAELTWCAVQLFTEYPYVQTRVRADYPAGLHIARQLGFVFYSLETNARNETYEVLVWHSRPR